MKRIGAIILCSALIISASVVLYLKLKLEYSDADKMIASEFSISGIENGMAVYAGEEITGIYVSAPDVLEDDEIMSVSTDTDVAYLVIDKENSDDRVYSAVIKAVSEGIAEMYISSTDGTHFSEKITVNVIKGNVQSDVAETTDGIELSQTELTNFVAVYVTPSGTKYHLSKNCAGENSTEKALKTAVEEGYLPCKNCAMKD